jgi:4-amino-4-deoxy-L-arabinose transferase-like glycosyltransferase
MSETTMAAGLATPTARRWERIILGGLIVLSLALGLINLPYAPRTWFDEGSHLHVPKTLVQYGVYADISSEGFRYYGPTVGVGPTVMLPIAGLFKLVGIGLLQGRIVIVGYLLLALCAGYLLARRLHGPWIALLVVGLLLASRTLRYEGLVEYGRQVLGEVPGVAFLLLGALAWIKALDDRRPSAITSKAAPAMSLYSILAGLAFGLALVTKNQFVLIVPPTLLLLALLDWRYYRLASWWFRLVPLAIACACFGLWMLVQLQFLGPGSFASNLALTRKAAGGAIFVFDLEATRRALVYLVQAYGGLLLPALAYGLWRCRARTAQALAELLIVLLATLWLCWYLVSLGWPRYAFPALVFGSIAVARLLFDLFAWLRKRQPLAAWALACYTAAVLLLPLSLTIRNIFSPDDSAQRMAAYLISSIPTTTIIETWEPELGVLTDHRYHYPPIELLDEAVRNTWLDGPPLAYNGLEANPEYVVVGPFGGYVAIYPTDVLAAAYEREHSEGPYTLFRRR